MNAAPRVDSEYREPPDHSQSFVGPADLADDEENPDEAFGNIDDGRDGVEDSPVPDRARALRARRIGRSWGRFAQLWVPEPLRDARVDPGRRGAIVLLLVATLAATATAIGVWRDRPEPRPVESSVVAALAVASGPVTPASTIPVSATESTSEATGVDKSSAQAAAEMVISVTGAVGNPGVVTLSAGARVADAIAAAGGAAAGADLTGLNLAARLADGDSVVVGASGSSVGATSGLSGAGDNHPPGADSTAATTAGSLINLNGADEAALDTLPGVGPVMAKNILAWRDANGKFSTVEQLQEISGIGPSRFAQIAPLVTVS